MPSLRDQLNALPEDELDNLLNGLTPEETERMHAELDDDDRKAVGFIDRATDPATYGRAAKKTVEDFAQNFIAAPARGLLTGMASIGDLPHLPEIANLFGADIHVPTPYFSKMAQEEIDKNTGGIMKPTNAPGRFLGGAAEVGGSAIGPSVLANLGKVGAVPSAVGKIGQVLSPKTDLEKLALSLAGAGHGTAQAIDPENPLLDLGLSLGPSLNAKRLSDAASVLKDAPSAGKFLSKFVQPDQVNNAAINAANEVGLAMPPSAKVNSPLISALESLGSIFSANKPMDKFEQQLISQFPSQGKVNVASAGSDLYKAFNDLISGASQKARVGAALPQEIQDLVTAGKYTDVVDDVQRSAVAHGGATLDQISPEANYKEVADSVQGSVNKFLSDMKKDASPLYDEAKSVLRPTHPDTGKLIKTAPLASAPSAQKEILKQINLLKATTKGADRAGISEKYGNTMRRLQSLRKSLAPAKKGAPPRKVPVATLWEQVKMLSGSLDDKGAYALRAGEGAPIDSVFIDPIIAAFRKDMHAAGTVGPDVADALDKVLQANAIHAEKSNLLENNFIRKIQDNPEPSKIIELIDSPEDVEFLNNVLSNRPDVLAQAKRLRAQTLLKSETGDLDFKTLSKVMSKNNRTRETMRALLGDKAFDSLSRLAEGADSIAARGGVKPALQDSFISTAIGAKEPSKLISQINSREDVSTVNRMLAGNKKLRDSVMEAKVQQIMRDGIVTGEAGAEAININKLLEATGSPENLDLLGAMNPGYARNAKKLHTVLQAVQKADKAAPPLPGGQATDRMAKYGTTGFVALNLFNNPIGTLGAIGITGGAAIPLSKFFTSDAVMDAMIKNVNAKTARQIWQTNKTLAEKLKDAMKKSAKPAIASSRAALMGAEDEEQLRKEK